MSTGGRGLGQFHWPHKVAADSDGNLDAGEVDGNPNVTRFLRYGSASCGGAGVAEIGRYRQSQ